MIRRRRDDDIHRGCGLGSEFHPRPRTGRGRASTCLQEESGGCLVAPCHGGSQGRASAVGRQQRVGAAREERREGDQLALLCGHEECAPPVLVGCADVGARSQRQLQPHRVARGGCEGKLLRQMSPGGSCVERPDEGSPRLPGLQEDARLNLAAHPCEGCCVQLHGLPPLPVAAVEGDGMERQGLGGGLRDGQWLLLKAPLEVFQVLAAPHDRHQSAQQVPQLLRRETLCSQDDDRKISFPPPEAVVPGAHVAAEAH
mmetsp:Transcript_2298/g.7299  ORF Transcript_2298/g.7299 Transcript_2298/m.7299 type:complete len:257 (+) Transcript_2298:766-1536(+)